MSDKFEAPGRNFGTVPIFIGQNFTRMITPKALIDYIPVIVITPTMMVIRAYSPRQPILAS